MKVFKRIIFWLVKIFSHLYTLVTTPFVFLWSTYHIVTAYRTSINLKGYHEMVDGLADIAYKIFCVEDIDMVVEDLDIWSKGGEA